MKKRDVLITVKGKQQYLEHEDSMEMVTTGNFFHKGDAYYVVYKESEISHMDGTTTTLKINPDKLTLLRFGTSNSQMIFEYGQKYQCHYDTPHGAFTMGITSHQIDIKVDDAGGAVKVVYDIQMDNKHVSKNSIEVIIRLTEA